MSADQKSPDELSAAAVHGVRWTAISRPAVEIVLLGSMVVVARLVSPAEFGRVAVTLALYEMAIMVPAEGVGTALVQRATVTREHLQAGVALGLLIGAGLTVLTLVAAMLLIDPIFGGRTADLVRLSTPGFLLTGASVVPMALLRRGLAFRTLSVVDILGTCTRAGVSVGLALAGLEGESLIIAALVATAVATVTVWVAAPAPAPRLRRAPARGILSYGLPAALASVSWVGFRNCDYAIVGARLGATQAGLYFRAYTLAVEYQKKISLVMGQVGFPLLARAGGQAEIAALRGRMVRLLTIVLFPWLALLAITAPVLVPWLFSPVWQGAVVPTQVLAVGGAATLVMDGVGAALMAEGRPSALLAFGWAHFIAYAATVLVIAPLGLTAVAVGASVVHTAFLVVAYFLMLRGRGPVLLPLRELIHDVGPAVGACVGLVVAAVPVDLALGSADVPALPHLLADGMAGGLAYLITLRVVFPGTWSAVWHFLGRVVPRARLRAVRRLVPAGARPGG
jgi:PST family polysaccharide transporter